MANLLSWGKKAVAQVNPFDNGRTWQNPNPTNNQSVATQAFNAGSRVPVLGPILQADKGLVQGARQIVNSPLDIAKYAIDRANGNQVAANNAFNNARQGANQAVGFARNFPRGFAQLYQTALNTPDKTASNPLERLVLGNDPVMSLQHQFGQERRAGVSLPNAITGAGLSALNDVGGVLGAAGGAETLAKRVSPVLKESIPTLSLGSPGIRAATKASGLKPTQVVSDGEVNMLRDWAEHQRNNLARPNSDINTLGANVRTIADKTGLDKNLIVNGTHADITAAIDKYAAQRNAFIKTKQAVAEGGGAKAGDIPGLGKLAKDNSPPLPSGVSPKTPLTDKNIKTGDLQAQQGSGTKSEQTKFSQTAIKSGEVSPEVQKMVKENPSRYNPVTNKAQLKTSEDFVKQGLDKAHTDVTEQLNAKLGTINDQTVSDAIATAKALDAKGGTANLQKSTDLYNKLGEHLSKQGQSIQAASLLNNRTLEGLQYGAIKALKKGGVDITPEIQDNIKSLIGDVKKTTTGSDPHQLAVSKLAKYVNDKLPRTKTQAAVGIWRAGLLTGPETATKVAFSHAITLPFETAAQIPTAIADRAFSFVTGKRATRATLRGVGSGFAQGGKDFGLKMKTGIDAPNSGGSIPDFGSSAHQTPYENFVGNLHGGLFKPAYEGRYKVSLNDQALTEAGNRGLKGAEKQAFMKDFVNNPSDKVKQTAAFDAARATNQQETDLGKMASGLQHVTVGGLPIGKIIVPFTRIPSAIGTVGIVDYTPFGVAREVASQIKAGHFDQRLMSQAIGRSATGTATAALGAALMTNGRMTLKAPSDKKDRALWDLQGKQPNSIYIGGTVKKNPDGTFTNTGGRWMTINALGAIGITLGVGGALGRALNQSKGDVAKAVPDALASGSRLLLDQPYFKGIAGVTNALNDPTRYGQTLVNNTVGSVVPVGVQQVARGGDPLQRAYPGNLSGQLKNEIPRLREQNTPLQDFYGNKLPGTGGSLKKDINGTVNPFYPQAARNQGEPVTQELQRLYNNLGSSSSPNIAQPDKNFTINGQKLIASPQQLEAFISQTGPQIKNGIANLLKNPQYQQLSDGDKANEINRIITAAHGAGQITQFGNNPKSITTATKTALNNPSALGTTIATKTAQQTKLADDFGLNQAQLTSFKLNDNVTAYLNTAQSQINNISQQLKNPNLTDTQKLSLQNQSTTLQNNISKYQSYGGFTKPKKGKSLSSSLKLSGVKAFKPPKGVKVTVSKASFKAPKTKKLAVSKIPSNYSSRKLA